MNGMSKDKTTPKPADEATPQDGSAERVTPVAEPNAAAEESSEEKLARLEKEAAETATLRKRLTDHEAEVTRQQQLTAELTRRNQQYEEWIRAQQAAQQRQADPAVALRERLKQAAASFDPEAQTDAILEAIELGKRDAYQRALSDSMEAFRLQKTIEEMGQDFGEIDGNEINRKLNTLSAADRVRSMMLLEAERNGKLPELVVKREERRKAEADRASAINGLLGQGSPGRVPGDPSGGNKTVPWVNWAALNEETRKKLTASGYRPESVTQG